VRSVAAFTIPRKPPVMLMSDEALASMPPFEVEVAQWVDRVNTRAGRKIVVAAGERVALATSGQLIKGFVLIVEAERANQPTTFIVADRMELLA
jgi:hypothetical protein